MYALVCLDDREFMKGFEDGRHSDASSPWEDKFNQIVAENEGIEGKSKKSKSEAMDDRKGRKK